MKREKKQLATNISETLREKLIDSDGEAKKLKKAIKKTAKKLAETVIKVSEKQEKKLEKAKDKQDTTLRADTKMSKKQKIETGLLETNETERESLSVQEDRPSK